VAHDLTPEQKRQCAEAVEALGDLINNEATGHDDDDLVCIQGVVDAIADACGQDRVQLPNDGWIEAGEVRRRTREIRAAMARGEI
jgi:hypothetical protein